MYLLVIVIEEKYGEMVGGGGGGENQFGKFSNVSNTEECKPYNNVQQVSTYVDTVNILECNP